MLADDVQQKFTDTATQLAQIASDDTFKNNQFVSHLPSYIGIKNKGYLGDNGTRVYLLPKASVTDGTGAALKLFGDAYNLDDVNYRDLGIYFNANQQGDNGSNGKGVFWINGKVNGTFNGLNPDIAFGFQDATYKAMRIALVNNNPCVIIGPNIGRFHTTSAAIGLEMQKDIVIYKDTLIRFENESGGIGNGFRYKSTDAVLEYLFNGARLYSVDTNKYIINNALVQTVSTVNNNTVSLDVTSKNNVIVDNTAATTITALSNGSVGQRVTLVFNNLNTVLQNNTNIKIAGGTNYTPPSQYSNITLLKVNVSTWVEVGRTNI
jgi:hypothetical protein